jgi:HD superfamily phosphodiesterase
MSVNDTSTLDVEKHMGDPRIARLYALVREWYANARLIAHGMDHIERDLVNALVIGETEDCKMPIVTAAILLHDIGFLAAPDAEDHNVRGAQLCSAWLQGWSVSDQAEIAECILRHKGVMEGWNTTPENIEQKIVCDADLLEKVGYVGLVQGLRVFIEFGASYAPQYNSLSALATVLTRTKTVHFYTRKGREMADERGGIGVRVALMEKTLEEAGFYVPALKKLAQLELPVLS